MYSLVQEYKKAEALSSVMDRLSLRDIKKIAVAILEILVYLQEQNPSIIHRDIKPENILVTKDLQILEQ
nr:protein kinase [Gloeocapsa sp. PCC 73106]